MSEDDDDTQWTLAARTALNEAGDGLLAAIHAQLDFLMSAELAHADGWDSLDRAPGLTPLGSVIVAIEPTDQIEFSRDLADDEEPDRNFVVDRRVLYTEENQYF